MTSRDLEMEKDVDTEKAYVTSRFVYRPIVCNQAPPHFYDNYYRINFYNYEKISSGQLCCSLRPACASAATERWTLHVAVGSLFDIVTFHCDVRGLPESATD